MYVETTIYVLSEKDAREKIMEWHKDKKNLKIHYARPSSSDEGYDVAFSYNVNDEHPWFSSANTSVLT